MMIRNCALVVVVLLACGASDAAAQGAEFSARGTVIKVIPIKETSERLVVAQDCVVPRPARGGDLAELLRWDLRVDCEQSFEISETITAYRVYYTWDGRTYDVLMGEPPGRTIPVQINID